ncbi:glycosyltransferase family 4 protein [Candidatus Methylomirabilis sp.]|uniref:glycosyltransferase family 4 protein n=1 Tax=Candidatus Methylomirabilis sp. TaxID=2032687 RepID=UPI0030764CF4
MKAIHQLLPNLSYGDAISNQALWIRGVLRSLGYRSHIYVRYIDPAVQHECSYFLDHKSESSPQHGVIFHHSIGSEVTEYLKTLPDRKLLVFHNITPAKYFRAFRPEFAALLEKGTEELKLMASLFHIAVGISRFNAATLLRLGFPRVEVLPLCLPSELGDARLGLRRVTRIFRRRFTILYVGRVVPNKRFEDLIRAFYAYRHIFPNSRLLLVGQYEWDDPYYGYLLKLATELQVDSGVRFLGLVSWSRLRAAYAAADVFLSMSEHEGFCAPLVEAMRFEIPILAYKSSAVPETLGNAGILFTEKRFDEIAEMIELIRVDRTLRRRLVMVQRERLEHFREDRVRSQFLHILKEFESS